MTTRWWVAGAALAVAGCDTPPPDPDPGEVAAVDVPEKREDRDRDGERVIGRDHGHGRDHAMPAVDPFADDHKPAEHLVATISGLGDHKDIHGVVHLHKDHEAVKVDTMVEGLPIGTHAYHLHLYGDCSSVDGESAGPHLNFHGPSMDHAETPGTARDATTATMIRGNLGDLVAGGGQPAVADGMVLGATWSETLLGRSVVIHEKPNDPTAGADGGAGARIACGVLGLAKDAATTPGSDATAEADPSAPAKPTTEPEKTSP